MSWFRRIERNLSPFAISNISLYIVIAQVFVLLSGLAGLIDPGQLEFVPALVQQGEYWRVVTFLVLPPAVGYIWVAFALYLFYMLGSALEHHWGALKYNLFLLTGYALTVGLAFIEPVSLVTHQFLAGSVFLAFAYLNPDFVFHLFFVLPVKVRWLALFSWLFYGYAFIRGDLGERLMIVAAVGNFIIFFARDIVLDLRAGQRRRQVSALRAAAEEGDGPRHRCFVCEKNSDSHPTLDFRYCSKCAGDQCYCPDHIRDHEHVTTAELPK